MSQDRNICTNKSCHNFGRYCRLHLKPSTPKKKKALPKRTEKQAQTLVQYRKLRATFLLENSLCQAKLNGCKKHAAQVHHKKGKVNQEDWLNTKEWLAVCAACHDKLEKNPAMAKAKNLSSSRLNKTTHE